MAACALAVMGFVACSKDDNATINNEAKVNFAVADKPCFVDTRATKSAWANGDQIMIFFKPADAQKYLFAPASEGASVKNTIQLKFNDGTWTMVDNIADKSVLGEGGTYNAVHIRAYDDLNLRYRDENGGGSVIKIYAANGGEILQATSTYTYDNANGLDLGMITMKHLEGLFQISVENLKIDGADLTNRYPSLNWEMKVKDNNGDYLMAHSLMNLFMYTDNGSFSVTTGNNYAAPVVNGDDFSYCFLKSDSALIGCTIELTCGPMASYSYTIPNDKSLVGGKAYIMPAITDSKWTME